MWISKEEYINLKKYEKKYTDDCACWNTACKCKYIEQQENLVSFSTYYAERLEWWKGQFDKKPENHKLKLYFDNGQADVVDMNEYNSAESLYNKETDDYFEINGTYYYPCHIVKIKTIEGHPDPYTSEEIEAWAKEQLEDEMKGWKVVKEERNFLTATEMNIMKMQNASQPYNGALFGPGHFGYGLGKLW